MIKRNGSLAEIRFTAEIRKKQFNTHNMAKEIPTNLRLKYGPMQMRQYLISKKRRTASRINTAKLVIIKKSPLSIQFSQTFLYLFSVLLANRQNRTIYQL